MKEQKGKRKEKIKREKTKAWFTQKKKKKKPKKTTLRTHCWPRLASIRGGGSSIIGGGTGSGAVIASFTLMKDRIVALGVAF